MKMNGSILILGVLLVAAITSPVPAQEYKRDSLPDWVNSDQDDYYPVWHPSGDTLYFVSNRKDREGITRPRVRYATYNGRMFDTTRLYPIDMRDRSAGAVAIDQRGLMIIAATLGFNDRGHGELWESVHYEKGKRMIERLDGETSSSRWERDPSLTVDGSTLFFASNGFGVPMTGRERYSDIFISRQQPNGKWGEPVNLGPNVNTDAPERLPSISAFGNILYFTRVHNGVLTLYKSLRTGESDTSWSIAEQLLPMFNDGLDVLGFAPHPSGAFVIISARRKDHGYDLYRIDLTKDDNKIPLERERPKKD